MNSIKNTCCICLLDSENLISIFDNTQLEDFIEKILAVTGVDVSQSKETCESICEKCSSDLIIAHNFVTRFRSTQLKLKDYAFNIDREVLKYEEVKLELHSDPEAYNVETFDAPEYYSEAIDPDDIAERPQGLRIKRKYKKKTKEKISKRKVIKCKICGRVCQSKSALLVHERTHTGEKPYQCSHCLLSFAQKGTMLDHVARKHIPSLKKSRRGTGVFVCDVCGKRLANKRAIVIHMRVHTGEKPYACPHCPYASAQVGSVIRHRRIHSGEKPYACETCGKRFADKMMVKRHHIVHSKEKNFTCSVCGLAVKTRSTLALHMKHHEDCDESIVCEHCGRTFRMKGNLVSHIRKVHSEKSGLCSVCDKQCSDLQKHMRKHTGEVPFECRVCHVRYAQSTSLKKHMLTHTAPDKFKCLADGCPKTFPFQFMLDFHVKKYHTKEKPYLCEHCNRAFIRSCDLRNHLRGSHQTLKI